MEKEEDSNNPMAFLGFRFDHSDDLVNDLEFS